MGVYKQLQHGIRTIVHDDDDDDDDDDNDNG